MRHQKAKNKIKNVNIPNPVKRAKRASMFQRRGRVCSSLIAKYQIWSMPMWKSIKVPKEHTKTIAQNTKISTTSKMGTGVGDAHAPGAGIEVDPAQTSNAVLKAG